MLEEKKLQRVTDAATILNLINGAKENALEVYVWKLVGDQKHLGSVRIESVRKTRKDFCLVPLDGQERAVQDLMGSQGHIDLYIPDSAVLMRCGIKQTDAPIRYYISFPSIVAQVERRKCLRLNVYENSEVKICFAKTVTLPRSISQHFLKSCIDISSGGFAFYVSKMESKFFQVNDSIEAVEVKAGNWTAKFKSQVTTIREVEPDEYNGLTYKVWRVSCKFVKIDMISKKYIERLILERIKDELRVINE